MKPILAMTLSTPVAFLENAPALTPAVRVRPSALATHGRHLGYLVTTFKKPVKQGFLAFVRWMLASQYRHESTTKSRNRNRNPRKKSRTVHLLSRGCCDESLSQATLPYWHYDFKLKGRRYRGSTKTESEHEAQVVEREGLTSCAALPRCRHDPCRGAQAESK
jgi:hypothetical protein